MGEQLSDKQVRDLRHAIRAAQLNIRLAWAGALDAEAERQLRLAEGQLAAAIETLGSEPVGVQSWEAQ